MTERWLGEYYSADEHEIELNRVAIVEWIDGRWFAATSIIDADRMTCAITNRRTFDTRYEVKRAFNRAR